MRLLSLVSWPYARKHAFRTLLTLLSITVGVALFVGMHLGSQAILEAFHQAVDRIAGATQLQISAGDNGFPEDVLQKVQNMPEIVVASPVIEAVVESEIPGQGSLLILAVDTAGDQNFRRYEVEGGVNGSIEDPLEFLAHANSILISRQIAERAGLHVNSSLPLRTVQGVVPFRVSGILRSGGLASAYAGSLAVMDIYAAQRVFGRGHTFDRIDIGVREGVPVEICRQLLQERLGPGFQVEEPSGRRQGLLAVTRSLAFSINVTSLFALLIGMFIIYNTFSIAVAERRSEVGILRALGASRGSIARLFLVEGAMAGLIGSVAGIPAGRLMATGIARFLDHLMRGMYGLRLPAAQPAISTRYILAGIGAGVAASILGALLPSYSAARQDPVTALQKGRARSSVGDRGGLRRWLALVCAGASAACLLWSRSNVAFYSGYFLFVAGTVLLAPSIIIVLLRALRPALKAAKPVEGTLAADNLLQELRRTSITVSALMLALAMAISFAGIALASRQSVREWLQNGMCFDLFVTANAGMADRSFRFPASLGQDLERIPAIEEAQPVRVGRVPFRGALIMLLSTDIAKLANRIHFKVVEGKTPDMVREAAEAKGVIVSENLSLIHNVHLGEVIELGTPAGPVSLPVVGVHVDYSDQEGSMLVDRALYLRYWKDPSVDVFRLFLRPGVDQQDARRTILDRFASRGRLFVMTTAEVKQYVLRIADQWFAVTYVQLAIAVLVAILGVVNSLTVSVLDRRRELAVLQAVGGLRSQVRRAIWIEAVVVGFVGLVMGIVLGAVMLGFNVYLARLDSFGYRFDYLFPYQFAVLLFPVILAASFLASIWPAEMAVRGQLIKALEYE